MKNTIYLFLTLIVFSCAKDEEPKPSFTTQSYSAEIGDIITLKGENLASVKSINIYSADYTVPGEIIVQESGLTYRRPSFINQSESEIQFTLPELYADSYIMEVGDLEIPLKIKGFIPLTDIIDLAVNPITGIKVIDEEKALVTRESDLYLFENGYHNQRFLSRDVHYFGSFENGDSWYVKSNDWRFYEIFYNEANSSEYNLLTSFNKSEIPDRYNIRDIVVTLDKEIYISNDYEGFLLLNGEFKNIVDIYAGLEAYSKEEIEIDKFKLTPSGLLYTELNQSFGFLILNPKDLTFAFSEEFTSYIEGPSFANNTGYLMLPLENRLFKSTDEGRSWSESSVRTPTHGDEEEYYSMNIIDANTIIYLVHSYTGYNHPYTIAYKTTDGGNSWREQKLFNHPREIDKYARYSDIKENGGLVFFIDHGTPQLYKYIP